GFLTNRTVAVKRAAVQTFYADHSTTEDTNLRSRQRAEARQQEGSRGRAARGNRRKCAFEHGAARGRRAHSAEILSQKDRSACRPSFGQARQEARARDDRTRGAPAGAGTRA